LSAEPRLSIGLPVYNGERYLAESLDALLGQTYKNFELIISDNASTDGTAAICREYARQDPRIRYLRQSKNIGAAPNHNFVLSEAKGELFKWAAADDLYARDHLERCIAALDEHPDFVLADSWTAAISDSGEVVQALPYPLATDSLSASVRFRSMLFGASGIGAGLIQADDMYGVMRTDVLRRIPPHGSFFHADRVLMTEIALNGRFYQIPDWLYFRRDHADRPQHAMTSVRSWCANLDPRRRDPRRHPTVRLVAEYFWGYAAAISRAPLSAADRRACYILLLRWIASRATHAVKGAAHGKPRSEELAEVPRPTKSISLDTLVAGREGGRQ
jgi:glycosyltransferase involved in cell wall biosynthesis